jgi:hypothetical protein
MADAISDNQKKKRGRPATGSDPLTGVRFTGEMRAAIDDWAADAGVTRAEAIRRLVGKALGQ